VSFTAQVLLSVHDNALIGGCFMCSQQRIHTPIYRTAPECHLMFLCFKHVGCRVFSIAVLKGLS